MREVASFVQGDRFLYPGNAWLWEAACRVHDAVRPSTNLTVIQEFRNRNQLTYPAAPLLTSPAQHPHRTSTPKPTHDSGTASMLAVCFAAAVDNCPWRSEENAEIGELIGPTPYSRPVAVTERRLRRELGPIRPGPSEYFDRIEFL